MRSIGTDKAILPAINPMVDITPNIMTVNRAVNRLLNAPASGPV